MQANKTKSEVRLQGDPWSLQGRRTVITGATTGIGRAIAEEFIMLGAEVLVVSRSEAHVSRACSDLAKPGALVHGLPADVTLGSGRDEIAAWVREKWGGLDVLVNNVGTNIRKPTLEYTDEEIDLLLRTNLLSMLHMCRTLHALLKGNSSAAIVNIGSVAGNVVVRTGSPYAAAKAGIGQLTRYLAVEWAADGIRVNGVDPWYIRTPLVESLLRSELYLAAVLARTPLRRVGDPREVARAAAFLAMDASSFVTGQCLSVDGGFSVLGFEP